MNISISKIRIRTKAGFLIAKEIKDFIESEILPELEKLKAENEKLREGLKLTCFSLRDCIYELREACLDLNYSTDLERLYLAEKLLRELEGEK